MALHPCAVSCVLHGIGCPSAGRAIGGRLRAVGLTWNLAPVCDLAGWPSSLAVGTRSFGDGPELVGRPAARWTTTGRRKAITRSTSTFGRSDRSPCEFHCHHPYREWKHDLDIPQRLRGADTTQGARSGLRSHGRHLCTPSCR
ncbi:glycoside hydrolase family 3 N-terminal domain-containing protein [Streptomyces sp. NPDC056909]|uniref:glycoside hydrolase family 3 N-terminal domain-containing protein n=1 Tax=Streptomyces sp. NPDC056909 TaxID=3345963 RepID=UPI0036AC7E02